MNTKRNLEANKSSADGEKGNQNLDEKASTNSAEIVAELIRDVENSEKPFDVADLAYARSTDRSRKEKKEHKKDKKKKKKKKKRKHESRDRSGERGRERSRERSREKDKERKRKSKKSEKNREKEDIREKHPLKSPQKLKRTKLEESVSPDDEDDDFTVNLKAVKETKLVINIKSSLNQDTQKTSDGSTKNDRNAADDANTTLDDDDNTCTRASKIIEKTVARITKKEESRLRNRTRDDSSDEDRGRYRSKRDRSYNRDKNAVKPRRSRSRSRSRDRRRQRSRSYERRPIRKRYSRSRSRSRSDARTNDKIDKAKLLEIAQSRAQRIKAMDMLDPRSGNPKSIDDFVSYCEKLQKSQEKEDKAESGSGENDFEMDTFPARLKQAEPIKIKISNGSNFGSQNSEMNSLYSSSPSPINLEWKKVEPKAAPAPLSNEHKRYNAPEKKGSSYSILPPPPMPPSFLPPPPIPPTLCPPPPPMPVLSGSGNERSRDKNSTNQFAQVVAPRLLAPCAAFNFNSNYNDEPNFFHNGIKMTSWTNVTGKYTGSTGLTDLSDIKLPPPDGSLYTSAEKDGVCAVPPAVSVLGLKLMYKMGWRPGRGLGPKCEGLLEPLIPDIKHDRRGLQTEEERKTHLFQKLSSLSETSKHPVSQLMELCARNKWPLPQFYFSARGPSHDRQFSCSALVNNVQYENGVISRTKKDSKSSISLHILRKLGVPPLSGFS